MLALLLSACGIRGDIGEELIIEEGENVIQMAVYGADTYNPLRTRSQSMKEMLTLVYEPLFEKDEALRPIPCLAEKVQTAPDGMSATVFPADGIKWQDGSGFCADDIIYTINQIKSGDSLYKHNVAPIASAELQADGTVWLSLYEPVMNIEGLLTFPVIKNGSAETLNDSPNGTGAFEVSEKTATSLVLTPNKKRADTSVSAVNVRVLRSAEACVNAFESNDLDVITSSVIDLGVKTPGGDIQIKNYTSNRMTFLGFNCALEKYSLPDIRLAVYELINRDKLIEKAQYGRATACRLPFNPSSWLYVEIDGPELDVEGTMANAGYSKTNGVYTDAEGAPLYMSILVSEESVHKTAAAEQLASQLVSAGVTATVERVSFEEYTKRVNSGNYDVFIGEVAMQDNLDPGFLCGNGNYFVFYDDTLLTAGYNLRLSGDSEAVTEYGRAFTANPPYVPLFFANDGVVYRKSISGITEPNFCNNLYGLENWYFRAEG